MPSQYSVWLRRSLTAFSAQKVSGTTTGVASQVTALAPFSQNSNALRWWGSGHAQLGQSKPSFWFIAMTVLRVRFSPICSMAGFMEWYTPGTPAAQLFGPSPTTRSFSDGSSM
ncbi:hypothetical protein SRABI128_04279 [Microbacterium sp. Bi128]|nr:hypothetical protein SRABI128_04279 [Microbacterium sp. Bi128]